MTAKFFSIAAAVTGVIAGLLLTAELFGPSQLRSVQLLSDKIDRTLNREGTPLFPHPAVQPDYSFIPFPFNTLYVWPEVAPFSLTFWVGTFGILHKIFAFGLIIAAVLTSAAFLVLWIPIWIAITWFRDPFAKLLAGNQEPVVLLYIFLLLGWLFPIPALLTWFLLAQITAVLARALNLMLDAKGMEGFHFIRKYAGVFFLILSGVFWIIGTILS